jgi:hypothetical protein
MGGTSYCSASDMRLHFGLGAARLVDRFEVTDLASRLRGKSANLDYRIPGKPNLSVGASAGMSRLIHHHGATLHYPARVVDRNLNVSERIALHCHDVGKVSGSH